jgi:O-antigen/teichoic acid export membrane protein
MTRFFKGYVEIFSKFIANNKFLSFGFFLTVVQVMAGAFGYLYQILMGRLLSPGDFALFSSLMASFMFLGAPMVAASMLIVRKVSGFKASETLFLVKPFLFRVYKLLIIASIVILLIFWAINVQLREYLRIPSISTLFLFEIVLIFSLFNTVNSSLFQGLQKFIYLGIVGLIAVILKMIISVIFISFGLAIDGALSGILLSMLIVFIIGAAILWFQLPRSLDIKESFFNISAVSRIYPVLSATIAASAMTQLDMVLVNWYFPPREAGLYAAASVLGKAILYLPGGLIVALFPMVSELHSKGESGLKIFRQSILATLICCGSVCAIYWMFGDQIIKLFYGQNYDGAGQILRWYGFAILPMATVIIAEQYLIARGQVLFAWIFLAIAPLQILAIYLWHTELWMILLSMGVFGALLAFIGCLFMFLNDTSRENFL